jgi:hypothetical protein
MKKSASITRLPFLVPIDDHISRVVRIIVDHSDVESLLLLGSAARGELSVRQDENGTVELFSDYEFLAVTSTRPLRAQHKALHVKLAELEQQIANPNPLFHIDLIVRERARLRSFPLIIFTFELKQNALVLYGEDIRAEIPDVTLQNLDFHNTHEILYKRLWAILLHLPKRFVVGHASETEHRVTGYVLCRNALDLTTVLLPHEGVLLPTYAQRVAYLREHYSTLCLPQALGPEFPGFLQDCLDRRLDLDFARMDLRALYGTTLGCLERGLATLLPGSNTDLAALPQHARRIFNESPISRGEWYNLARLTLALTRQRGPFQALRWLRLPKKGWLTLGLLAMHKALLAWFTDEATQAEGYLAQAWDILHMLSVTPLPRPQGDFLQRWLALRVAWGEFWRQYIRLGGSSYAERFRHIMEWVRE